MCGASRRPVDRPPVREVVGIGKAGAIHIKGKMIFPADFAESC